MLQLSNEEKKIELINDLISTITTMDEIWEYHPYNPNHKNIIDEYDKLMGLKQDLEDELKNLEYNDK